MHATPIREHPSELTADELIARLLERRAVEAVIWGMPAVNYDLMYQAMVRAAKGKGWNVILRFYGPLQPWFDKTWWPGEIELLP